MKLFLTLMLTLALASTAMADTKKKHKAAPAAASAPEAKASAPSRSDDGPSGGVPGEPEVDGCGLGWQVINNHSILGSIIRGTTNSTVPPSFGMTSGTLGCKKIPFTKRDEAGAVYATSNFDSLRVEMAEGHGEVLEAFARTIGCNETAAFGRMTQKNYGTILDGSTTPVRMFLNVKQQIQRDPQLAKSCAV